MVDYYRILKISPKATEQEIKSAYRRLARKLHPDTNNGSENNSREFAKIAKAYQILSSVEDRARYDKQRLQADGKTDSVMFSDNPHARRLRRMAVQKRMDAIVDRMIERERRETLALQQTVFPVVALFLSTLFVGMLKPQIWTHSTLLGKSILITLFIAGTWHLIKRMRTSFERYTYTAAPLHDSVLRETDDEKPFSLTAAIMFLLCGIAASLGIGLALGNYLEWIIANMMGNFFGATLQFELIFYPPIAVMTVDAVHAFANKADL